MRSRFGTPMKERLPILEVRANAARGWEMTPNRLHYTYLHPVEVNSLGLRGAKIQAKSADELRILCLGDSLVYGQGVADGDTLPALLESELTAAGRKVTVINGGLRAYATHQQVGLLEELGARIEPDLVLLCWYWNDLQERDIHKTYERLEQSGPIAFDLGAPIDGWRKARWYGLQLLRRSAVLNLLHERFRPRPVDAWDEDFLQQGIAKLNDYLARMRELAQQLDADFKAVLLPDPGGRIAGTWGLISSDRAASTIEAHSIPLLDLRPAMDAWIAEHERAPILPFDGHYDATGNALMARCMAEWLMQAHER